MKNNNNDNEIIYIAHYSDIKNNRKGSPAAKAKLSYIFNCIKRINKNLKVLSFSMVDDRTTIYRKYSSYSNKINDINYIYFTNYSSKYRIIRVIGRILSWNEQKRYIRSIINQNKNCKIIIYHSVELFKLYKYLNRIHKDFCVEVEEIYSNVSQNERRRKKEIYYLQLADKYIFITELLNKIVNIYNKPYIISHGTYNVENDYKKMNFDKSKIHCVYAGTFDPKKGGAIAAVNAAKYLSTNYHIHILGFGSQKEVENIKNEIKIANNESKAIVSYDGLLSGDEYIKFIQSCNIGLSTQNPDGAFNTTSFPSKILSYMSNGLRVVSIRIPAIETSDIGKYMYYYDRQTPEDIANAIMNVNINDNYDGKKIIKKLDKKFIKGLENLLDE